MELVQYFASHIGETIISFYNRQSDTGDYFFSRPADQNHVCRFCTKRYLWSVFCGLSLATVQAFLVPSHKLSMILLSTTLATVVLMMQHLQYVLSIRTNPQPPSSIPTPAIPQFFRQENYLLSGWNKISSQAVLQRYFRDDGIPPPYDLPTILSAASNASNNGIDICLGRGSATAALVAHYTANGRWFASEWWYIDKVHPPIYWCVDELMITSSNKRMETASIHSYETVCASIAMDGGD